jgi:hypothetical protein
LLTKDDQQLPVSLAPGVDGDVLIADSTCALGLKWSPYSGGAGYGDTPVGTVSWFAGPVAPAGWLIADGAILDRTTYSALFAAIGTLYGAGNGVSTFQIPDLRGQFIRGWDAAGGTARGCDLLRTLGSDQLFAFQQNSGFFQALAGESGKGQQVEGVFCCIASCGYSIVVPSCGGSKPWGYRVCYDPSIVPGVLTACETRPMNVAMIPCIKWKPTLAPVQPSCGIPCGCIVGAGSLVVGSAASTPESLPVGFDGQIIVADSSCALGMKWETPVVNDISCDIITAKGDIIVGTGPSTPTALPAPTQYGQELITNVACPTGLEWKPGIYQCLTSKGALLTGDGTQPYRLGPAGGDGQLLYSCSACTGGLRWGAANYIGCNFFSAFCIERGQLMTTNQSGVPIRLTRGSEGSVLRVRFNAPESIEWADPDWVKDTCFNYPGDLLVGEGNNSYTALSVPGAPTAICNNCILVSSSSSTCGMNWVDPTGLAIPPSSFTGKGALLVGTAAGTYCSLPVPAQDNCVLTSCSSAPSGVIWATPAPVITYCCGVIETSATYGGEGTYVRCGWLLGPGSGLPLGLWKVDIFGKYCTDASINPYGCFFSSWYCDYAASCAFGPFLEFSIANDGIYQFAYSTIANNSFCSCGIYFNTCKANTRDLCTVSIFYTAIYLGQG